jgi:hypothetical protein
MRVSPTILRIGSYRFFFFSREEPRPHVHVQSAEGEAKLWLDPEIELAKNYGLNERDLLQIVRLTREHEDEIRDAWNRHFGT